MKLAIVVLLLGFSAALAQNPGSAAVSKVQSREIFRNKRVAAYVHELPPKQVGVFRETHDTISVAVSGEGKETDPGTRRFPLPGPDTTPGVVKLHRTGTSVSIKNTGEAVLRLVDIQFARPIGKEESPKHSHSHNCNEENPKVCVTERYLFCTPKLCAEEVTMAPGARSTRHSHDTEHMLIAIRDYSLVDDVSGKGIVHRDVKSGGVEYLPAGITHVLTNSGNAEARFIAIIFR